jgi:hypothetical protein
MSEKMIPTVVIQIKYLCEKEGCDGEMQFSGAILRTNPEVFAHVCDKCDYSKSLEKVYPFTKFDVNLDVFRIDPDPEFEKFFVENFKHLLA